VTQDIQFFRIRKSNIYIIENKIRECCFGRGSQRLGVFLDLEMGEECVEILRGVYTYKIYIQYLIPVGG